MMFLILIALWCVVFVAWSWLRPRRLSPPMFPGALPLIGHAHMIFGDIKHVWNIEKMIYQYSLQIKDIIHVRLGMHSIYVITDPEDSLIVANTCFNKPYLYGFGKKIYNRGLVTANPASWKPHRRLLNPAFNQQALYTFVDEFRSQAINLVTQLADEVGKGSFDVMPYFIDNSLNTACRTSLGLKIQDYTGIVKTYSNATKNLFALYLDRYKRVWLHPPYIFNLSSFKKKHDELIKIIQDITNAVIYKRKTELKTNYEPTNNMKYLKSDNFKPTLDHLLNLADKEDAFTDDEIREHLDTLVTATYDTTATALTFTLIQIGSNQKVQERIYAELREVLGGQDRDFNRHDLPKFVYLEAVIKESMRLYPPVPRIARTSHSDIKLKNYTLPADCIYVIPAYGINRHPIWGEDATQFKPDRWLNPAILPDNPNAFAAFSIGKRNCIGKTYAMMTMKMNLAYILRRYRVTADISNVETHVDLLLRPSSGHHISLELRV